MFMILQGNLREPVRRDSACASYLRHAAIDKQITLVLKIVKLLRNLAERAIPNQSVSSAKAIPCPSGADAVPTASRTPAVCACCRCSATAFITIKDGVLDRRSKELHLNSAGAERLRVAGRRWSEAQKQFEAEFGGERAANLRNELRALASSKLPPVPEAGGRKPSRTTHGGA
jgi:hypothetical protein